MPLQSTPAVDTDEPVDVWQSPVAPAVLRELSRLQPWRSFAHLLLEWLLIAAAIAASLALWQWNTIAGVVGYLAAVVWIGARQHALAILMHEAAHYRLMPNRTLNDFFGELLAGWPILISMRAYRWLHFAHHRAPNTHDDPDWMLRLNRDWQFPKTRTGLALLLLRRAAFFTGLFWIVRGVVGSSLVPSPHWMVAARIAFYVSAVGLLTWFGVWYEFLLYWIVPYCTWHIAIQYARIICEHSAVESEEEEYASTRTTVPALLESIFILPCNVGYHLEHHW